MSYFTHHEIDVNNNQKKVVNQSQMYDSDANFKSKPVKKKPMNNFERYERKYNKLLRYENNMNDEN
ncbi:putative ORfan [Saudi moumouvirus]|uniref:Uncharacterized protein n=1 Tax=Moumouvirus sp. 'Monve' TaxID=1128131 RepID=H2EEE7_9VIRU|nr:hypothetical protein mv_R565 [Moumouvirus Monve]AQN68334.1 putative ORfan [Saudi moumouvirus]